MKENVGYSFFPFGVRLVRVNFVFHIVQKDPYLEKKVPCFHTSLATKLKIATFWMSFEFMAPCNSAATKVLSVYENKEIRSRILRSRELASAEVFAIRVET